MSAPGGLPVAGIITPEAVPLRFDTATVGSRVVAELIDLSAMVAVAFAVVFGATSAGGVLGDAFTVIVLLTLVLGLLVGYPTAMEALWDGRTLGKAAMGLRVVTREGAPVRVRHSAIRAMIGLIEIFVLLGIPAVLSMLLTSRDQRLGDLVAGTLVLRQRPGRRPTAPVTFGVPWNWESWVATLDVSRLSAEQYGVVRAFLIRTTELSPDARWQISGELAAMVAHRMGVPVPPTVHPVMFLTGVATAYQRRFT
jgi:uncharacterized RDD family membrane protein YckC